MAKPVKIGVAIPNEGHAPWEAYDNRLMFAFHLGKLQAENPDKYEFHWASVGRVLTPLARERLSEHAVDGGMDLMLQIDDDMIIPMDMFERLHETLESEKADVVAPLAFMRVSPFYPVLYRVIEGYDAVAHKPFFHREFVKNYPKDSVVECDAVGFGSALIRVELLRKMKKPWFMSTTGAGEDIWFCTSAKREANAKIVMDTRIKLGHLGTQPIIDESTYEQNNKVSELRKYKGDAPRELADAAL